MEIERFAGARAARARAARAAGSRAGARVGVVGGAGHVVVVLLLLFLNKLFDFTMKSLSLKGRISKVSIILVFESTEYIKFRMYIFIIYLFNFYVNKIIY